MADDDDIVEDANLDLNRHGSENARELRSDK